MLQKNTYICKVIKNEKNMKTLTIEKVANKFNFKNPNEKLTHILVDGELICVLKKLENATREGYDYRAKFTVSDIHNSLGLSFNYRSARSIKQVLESLSFDLKNI